MNIYYSNEKVGDIIKRITSITRTLLNMYGFHLSITVLLPTDRNAITQVFHNNRNEPIQDISLYMTYPAFLTLQLPSEYGKGFDKEKRLIINAQFQLAFIEALEKFIEIFKRDDVFYLSGGKLCMYQLKPEHIITVKLKDSYVEFRPSIVEYMNMVYEGGEITLNHIGNSGQLTYQELKLLHFYLKKADLFMYSQLLLNYMGKSNLLLSDAEKERSRHAQTKLDEMINKVHVKGEDINGGANGST